jgi:hypothetical protein
VPRAGIRPGHLEWAYCWTRRSGPRWRDFPRCRGRGSTGSGLPRSGDVINVLPFVEKAEVVATLRSRELHGRADWVEREFPVLIDTAKNASLLRTLGIDVTAMTSNPPSGLLDAADRG